MDDHIYEMLLDYAKCELIPRFRNEYEAQVTKIGHGLMSRCDSYREMQALCQALNAIAPYAGFSKVSPRKFIEQT